MTKRCVHLLLCGAALVLLAGGARGQEGPAPAKSPAKATTQPAPKALQVTVKEATGAAQYLRAGKGQKWQPLKVGDKLDELTVIRTGFGSKVVLAFADNSTVTINRATKMGIGQFRRVGNVTKTRVGLKYGSMRMNVSKARGPNDFAVSTPVATLAVSGSISDTGYSDFGQCMAVHEGNWAMNMGPEKRNYKKGEHGNNSKPSISTAKTRRAVRLGSFFGMGKAEGLSLILHGGGRGAIGLTGAGEGARTVIRPPKSIILILRPVNIIVPGLDIDIGL